jgi:hypothetical protein
MRQCANHQPHDGSEDSRRYSHLEDRKPRGRGVSEQPNHESDYAAENAEDNGHHDSEADREGKPSQCAAYLGQSTTSPHAASIAETHTGMSALGG